MWYYSFVAKRFYPQHIKRRRRKVLLVAASFVLLVVLGLSFGIYKWKSSQVAWKDYTNEELGVRLSYPETFVEETLSEQYQKANIVFRITKNNPQAFFSLRYEDGLGIMKAFGNKDILGQLVAAVDRRYPTGFPDYKKDNYQDVTLAGEKAARFDFTYIGADKETRVRQRLVVVVKDETAYYLSAQAPENDFFKSEKDFAGVVESFSFLD